MNIFSKIDGFIEKIGDGHVSLVVVANTQLIRDLLSIVVCFLPWASYVAVSISLFSDYPWPYWAVAFPLFCVLSCCFGGVLAFVCGPSKELIDFENSLYNYNQAALSCPFKVVKGLDGSPVAVLNCSHALTKMIDEEGELSPYSTNSGILTRLTDYFYRDQSVKNIYVVGDGSSNRHREDSLLWIHLADESLHGQFITMIFPHNHDNVKQEIVKLSTTVSNTPSGYDEETPYLMQLKTIVEEHYGIILSGDQIEKLEEGVELSRIVTQELLKSNVVYILQDNVPNYAIKYALNYVSERREEHAVMIEMGSQLCPPRNSCLSWPSFFCREQKPRDEDHEELIENPHAMELGAQSIA